MHIHNIWLAITYACNLRCSICYAGSNEIVNHHKQMTLPECKEYIDLFLQVGLKGIIFIGGEPTVHPSLPEMIEYASRKNLRVGMVTNGRRLKELSYCRTLASTGLDHIAISIESARKDIHDQMTKVPGSFDDTVTGIENMLKTGVYTSTETTISRQNHTHVEEIVDFLIGLGVPTPGFNICTANLQRIEQSNDTITPLEGAKAIERAYQTAKARGKTIKSISPLPKCLFDPEIFGELERAHAINKSCYILYGTNTVVDYNGDILPCVHFSGFPLFNLREEGKPIRSDTFTKLYTSGLPAQFRDQLWRYPAHACKICKTWGNGCIGGCPIIWYKYDPNKEIPCQP